MPASAIPYPRGDLRHVRSFDEMVEDVGAVSLEKIRDFHQRFYGAARGEFAAAGDWIWPRCAALQEGFGDWKAGMPYVRVPSPSSRRRRNASSSPRRTSRTPRCWPRAAVRPGCRLTRR